jgi:hypothetical protein
MHAGAKMFVFFENGFNGTYRKGSFKKNVFFHLSQLEKSSELAAFGAGYAAYT